MVNDSVLRMFDDMAGALWRSLSSDLSAAVVMYARVKTLVLCKGRQPSRGQSLSHGREAAHLGALRLEDADQRELHVVLQG